LTAAEPHAYIDAAESIDGRSATFEEETATEWGASDDPAGSMWLTADSVPARLLLPGGAGSRTWGYARQRPGVQMIASEEMSSPTVPAPAP
jgi:hypothetical protein